MSDTPVPEEPKELAHVRDLIKWCCEHETPRASVRILVGHIDTLRAVAEQLKVELAAAKADAERYRWLRNRQGVGNRWPYIAQYPYHGMVGEDVVPQIWDAGYHPDKLDAAIDTARNGGKDE